MIAGSSSAHPNGGGNRQGDQAMNPDIDAAAHSAATAEMWVDGHVHALAFLGRVSLSVLYRDDCGLVSKILPDGTRVRAKLFNRFLPGVGWWPGFTPYGVCPWENLSV